MKRGEGERECAECQTTPYRREDQETHGESTKETHGNLDHVSGVPPRAGRCVRIPVSTEGINMVASPGCEECAVFTFPCLTGPVPGIGPTIPHINASFEFGLQQFTLRGLELLQRVASDAAPGASACPNFIHLPQSRPQSLCQWGSSSHTPHNHIACPSAVVMPVGIEEPPTLFVSSSIQD